MRIPKKFKLLSNTISVKYDENLREKQSLLGQADYENLRIILAPLKEHEAPTFGHELVHFILWAMSEDKLRKDEKFVDLFGRILIQCLDTAEYGDHDDKRLHSNAGRKRVLRAGRRKRRS